MPKINRGDRVTLISSDGERIFYTGIASTSRNPKLVEVTWISEPGLSKDPVKGYNYHASTGKCWDYDQRNSNIIRPFKEGDDAASLQYQQQEIIRRQSIAERELVEKQAIIAELLSTSPQIWERISTYRLQDILRELRREAKSL